jgi:hypothetical protein
MVSYGFSFRHWQRIEAGRPITVSTLLRICEALDVPLEQVVAGLPLRKRKDMAPGPRRPSRPSPRSSSKL